MPTPTILPTTELEAVNSMLRSITESQVDSLIDIQAPDAGVALQQLRETSRAVQLIGWHWNTDEEWVITPNGIGELTLPGNTLKVIAPNDQPLDLVQRGTRLYDRVHHTYIFTKPVTVALVTGVDFEELPEAARQLVMLSASVRFQEGVLGSAQLDKFAQAAMRGALQALEAAEAETGRYNILTGNWSTFRIIQRVSPP